MDVADENWEQPKGFQSLHKEQMDSINRLRNSIKSEINPNNLADLALQLSSWKSWLGEKMTESHMAYNKTRNFYQVKLSSSAAANIKAESTPQYAEYLFINQLYKDMQNLISTVRMKLKVMGDDRWG